MKKIAVSEQIVFWERNISRLSQRIFFRRLILLIGHVIESRDPLILLIGHVIFHHVTVV